MVMQFEELEAAATEEEIAAGKAKNTAVAGFKRRRPVRKPFPEHLPRERVVIDAPTACSCCGSDRIVKMGENISETLEVIPRQDGRTCLTNNAAKRALRGIALGRKSWLFAGSERGGGRAAFMYSLIVSAKKNDIDPQLWLADVLARLPDTTASRVPDLLPWNWQPSERQIAA